MRGLKPLFGIEPNQVPSSHPVWVRGLKHIALWCLVAKCVSHPVWVRGLKLRVRFGPTINPNVAPRVGAWIETFGRFCVDFCGNVAPRVGAWIETN